MPAAARLTDIFVGVCSCHPPLPPIPMVGTIITASGNVNSNELGTARVTDIVLGNCGHIGIIVTGSGDVNTNELSTAYVSSTVVGCLIGIITVGSANININ